MNTSFLATDVANSCGVVVIGRNEGERLRRCFESLRTRDKLKIVYVDSGSTDGSVGLAQTFDAEVVELDPSKPFSAARARNAGFRQVTSNRPTIGAVQFVDGDCEVYESWIPNALRALDADVSVGAVCGRRSEIAPTASIYNSLCDIEWNTPIGEAKSFGGDVMIRRTAFDEVGGYNPNVVSAEDDELSVRLRKSDWRLLRLNLDMTKHDASMFTFGQWWRRSVRTGHAYAEGVVMHGAPPENHFKRQLYSTVLWTLIGPLLLLITLLSRSWLWLLPLSLYGVVAVKATLHTKRHKQTNWIEAGRYGFFCVLAKIPQFVGVLTYWRNQYLGRASKIIEYKGPEQEGKTELQPHVSMSEQGRRKSRLTTPSTTHPE